MKVEIILMKRQAIYYLLSIGLPSVFYLIFSGMMSGSDIVREGIYSFEPISSLKVAGSCSGRERLSLDAPETARGDRLVNKIQANSAKTALAGIPISSHARLRHGFHLSSASTSSEKPNLKSKNTSRYFESTAMFSNLKTTFPNA